VTGRLPFVATLPAGNCTKCGAPPASATVGDVETALRLVLALHDMRDGPHAVPGFRVHLDPQAEAQVRNALGMPVRP
jgi:hypothetical protein